MGYMKNLSDSLVKRVLPNTLENIFPNEVSKVNEFNTRWKESENVLDVVQKNYNQINKDFEGFSRVGRKLSKQVRTGKFGLDDDKRMELMFGDMFADDSGSSTLGEFDENFNDISENKAKIAHQKALRLRKQKAMQSALSSSSSRGGMIDNGTVLVAEKLGFLTAVTAQVGNRTIQGQNNILTAISNIGSFLANETHTHYEMVNDFIKLNSSSMDLMMDVFTLMKEDLNYKKQERERQAAAKGYTGSGGFDVSKILDPSRDFGVSSTMDLLLGPMGLGGQVKEFNADPLGFLLGSALTIGASSYFGKQVDSVKSFTKSAGDRLQTMFEKWSNDSYKPGAGFTGMIKGMIGDSLKLNRNTAKTAKLGQMENGAVPFDSQTKKAIVDVIPMLLTKILKATSKSNDHEVYDEASGRFISANKTAAASKKALNNLRHGNGFGGLNSEMSDLSVNGIVGNDAARISAEIRRQARKSDSHNIDPTKIKFRNERLNGLFQDYMKNKSHSEINSFKESFYGHIHNSNEAIEEALFKMRSTGAERSLILNDDKIRLNQRTGEDEDLINDKKKKRKKVLDDLKKGGIPNAIRRVVNGENRADDTASVVLEDNKKSGKKVNPVKTKLSSNFTHDEDNIVENTINPKEEETLLGKLKDKLAQVYNNIIVEPFKKYISTPMSNLMTKWYKQFTSFADKSIVQPAKKMISATIDKANQFLFGSEAAAKQGLFGNIKDKLSGIWEGFNERFIQPLKNSIKELFGPTLKEFGGELKTHFKSFFKDFTANFRASASIAGKSFFATVMQSDTVKFIQAKITDPLKEVANKISETFNKAFKWLINAPVNLIRGASNAMKLSNIRKGKGNYSPEEIARLTNLENEGKIFNFSDTTASDNIAKKVKEAKLNAVSNLTATKNNGEKAPASIPSHKVIPADKSKLNYSNASNDSIATSANNDVLAIKAANDDIIKHKALPATVEKPVSHPVTANAAAGGSNGNHSGLIELIAANTTGILNFMKSNLNGVGHGVETIIKILKKEKNDFTDSSGKNKKRYSFFKNPIMWLDQQIKGIIGVAFNMVNSLVKGFTGVLTKIAEIPGKLVSVAVTVGKNLLSGITKLIPSITNLMVKGIEGVTKVATNLLSGLANVVSSVAKAGAQLAKSAIEFGTKLIKPLGDAAVAMTTSVVKAVIPMFDVFTHSISEATKGLLNFAGFLAKTAMNTAKGAINVGGRALGRVFGLGGGKGSTIADNATVKVTNFIDVLSLSKTKPLRVYVVDGKIATYEKSNKLKTNFNGNIETRNWQHKDKKPKDKKENNLLGDLASMLKLPNFGGLAGKVLTSAGGKIAGSAIGTAAGNAAGKAGSILTTGAGKVKDKISKVGKTDPLDKYNNAKKLVAERGASTGTAVGESAAGGVAKKSIGSRLGSAAKGIFKGGAGGIFKRLGKGFGIGSAVSLGGELAADAFFDKGTGMHDALATGSSYAGYGAMIGSVIPGIGTAVGAIVGGIIGAVKGAVPYVIDHFSKEITGVTVWFESIPARIAAYAEELPNKITSFFDQLPTTIANLFAVDDKAVAESVGNEDGKAPDNGSLMSRLFSAMGSAIWGVIKNLPRIGMAILGGLFKGVGSLVGSLDILITNSMKSLLGNIAISLGSMAERIYEWALHKLPMVGTSDEEYAQRVKAINDNDAKQKDDLSKSIAGNALEKAQNIKSDMKTFDSALPKSYGDTSDLSGQNKMYAEAVKAGNGDEDKIKANFAKAYAESNQAKGLSGDALKKATEDAYSGNKREQAYRDGKSATVPAGSPATGNKSTGVPANVKGAPASYGMDVDTAIQQAATKFNWPVNMLRGIAAIESGGRATAASPSGTYKGLFQMGPGEFKQFHVEGTANDPLDPLANAMAAANYMASNAKYLESKGVPVNAATIYLAHQQGAGGVSAIINAAKNGTPVPDAIAKNMMNNPPQDGKGKTSDPSQFYNRWAAVIAAKTGDAGIQTITGYNAATMSNGVPGAAGMTDEVIGNTSTAADWGSVEYASSVLTKLGQMQGVQKINSMVGGPSATVPSAMQTPAANSPVINPAKPTAVASSEKLLQSSTMASPVVAESVSTNATSMNNDSTSMTGTVAAINTAKENPQSSIAELLLITNQYLLGIKNNTDHLEDIANHTSNVASNTDKVVQGSTSKPGTTYPDNSNNATVVRGNNQSSDGIFTGQNLVSPSSRAKKVASGGGSPF